MPTRCPWRASQIATGRDRIPRLASSQQQIEGMPPEKCDESFSRENRKPRLSQRATVAALPRQTPRHHPLRRLDSRYPRRRRRSHLLLLRLRRRARAAISKHRCPFNRPPSLPRRCRYRRAWRGHPFLHRLRRRRYLLAFTRAIPNIINKPYLCGPIFGIGLFCFMQKVVIPLSALPKRSVPFTTVELIDQLLSHMLCVGLSIALMARRSARAT